MVLRSLRFRLVLWFLCIEAITLLIFSLLLYELLSKNLFRHHDDLLMAAQKNLTVALEPYAAGDFHNLPAGMIQPNEAIEIRSASGEVILSTEGFKTISNRVPKSLTLTRGTRFMSFETASGEPVRILATPLKGGRYLLLQASLLGDIKHTLAELRLNLFLLIPIALMATSFGGYLIARRALKPVDEITKRARDIRAKNLDHLLDVKTSDTELQNLVNTLNAMLDRLHSSFRNIQQFTADASHELRTPLTIIAGTLEVALSKERSAADYREAIETALIEINRLTGIVNDLLLLSALDTLSINSKRQEIDLASILNSVAELMQPMISDKGIETHVSVHARPKIIGDASQISQVLINLLENAVKYTASGGKIQLIVDQENSTAIVYVSDTGIGISKDEQSRIFDRFYQVDKTGAEDPQGTGLGLAIVKRIIEAHGGKIEVKSEQNTGSTFAVRFPIS